MTELILKGFINQNNQDNPILDIRTNTLGYTPQTAYNMVAQYSIILENVTYDKIFIPNGYQKLSIDYEFIIRKEDDNLITINVVALNGNNTVDGVMRNVPIEIIVFVEEPTDGGTI